MSRGKKVEVKCERCKTLFMARVADRKRGWGRFCSKSCKAIKQERRTGQFRDYLHQREASERYKGAVWNGEEMEFTNAHLYSNEDKYGYWHGEWVMNIKFGSVCSGIEAASMAWRPIGWEASWLSEIESFPTEVLKYHYPYTPNYGDMTKLPEMVLSGEIEAPDVLVGGTPCQSFSVAGMREGLLDERGQLTIKYVELANAIDTVRRRGGKDESIIVWENVPGVLSSKDNAFGCFLGALAGEDCELEPSGKRWSNAGYIIGPQRTIAWRILDAQYFGLAQRRKRVFVVASAREGFCPAKVLFEFDGVRRDIAPSRETGEEASRDAGGSFTSTSFGGYSEGVGTLRASGGDLGGGSETLVSYSFDSLSSNSMKSSNPHSGCREVDLAKTIDTSIPCPSKNQGGIGVVAFAQNTRDEVRYIGGDGKIAGALAASPGMKQTTYIAFNSRQDPVSGDVFGTLDTCIPQAQAIAIQGSVIGRKPENGPQGSGYDETGVCFTQTAVDRHAVTYSWNGDITPKNSKELSLTLRASQGGEGLGVAITCATKQQAMTTEENMASTLAANDYKEPQAVAVKTVVRRLTPIECERLQGFPDNFTKIPWRNKPAEDCPDGHRYKALGNSMAVPVMRWIGERINAALT